MRITAYSFGGNNSNGELNESMVEAAFSRYVIYRDPQGRVTSRILTFIPDKHYIQKYGMDASKNSSEHFEKNFSGYVEFRTFTKQMRLFVYRIKEGKVVSRIKLREKKLDKIVPDSKNITSSRNLSQCSEHCDPVYDIECHQGNYNPEASSGYDVICQQIIVDWDCYPDPNCNPDEGGDDPTDLCSGPDAYTLPECTFTGDPCIDWGFCPEPGDENHQTNQDIIDSLQGYPCAQSILAEITSLTDSVATVINSTFTNSCDFSMKFVHQSYPAGSNIDGEHKIISLTLNNGYNYNDGFKIQTKITINEDVLNHSTKEYILVTIYHEALHAFLNVEKTRLGSSFSSVYPDVNFSTINGQSFNLNNSIFENDHATMGVNFVTKLAKAIQAYNPNISLATAKAMAGAGILKRQPNSAEVLLNAKERDVRSNNYTGTKCP